MKTKKKNLNKKFLAITESLFQLTTSTLVVFEDSEKRYKGKFSI